jgi:hypothetical protein
MFESLRRVNGENRPTFPNSGRCSDGRSRCMEHSLLLDEEVDWLYPASGTVRHSLSCRKVGLAGSDWRALLSRGEASQSCRSCGRIPVETKRREVDEALTLARSLSSGPDAIFQQRRPSVHLPSRIIQLSKRNSGAIYHLPTCHLDIVRFFNHLHPIWTSLIPRTTDSAGRVSLGCQCVRDPATTNVSSYHLRQPSFFDTAINPAKRSACV